MINKHTQQKLIDKILESEEFANSKIYQTYLTYLVQAMDDEKPIKETTIAIDVFGKDSDFNPAEDTIVRSHTYTLRKKLERYYFTEGKDDPFRLKIPKGHYEASFVELSKNFYSLENVFLFLHKHYQLFIIVLLLIVLVGMLGYNQSVKNQLNKFRIIDPDDFIWKEYLQSKLPILIVPGDHFLFNLYSKEFNREFGIRDVMINSKEDLEEFKSQYPNTTIEPYPEPYFPYHSIWSLPPILTLLYSEHQKPILRKSSDINPEILNLYNIIFVGSIKTLYTLKHTFAKSHFTFNIAPHKVTYTLSDSGSIQQFNTNLHSSGPNEDLVLALKLPGPVNNSIFIMASYHSLGAPEIAKYFADQNKRKELKKLFNEKFNRTPKYFEILFRVTGIDKTAYSNEILIYNIIDQD
jgi:hypothetical protein